MKKRAFENAVHGVFLVLGLITVGCVLLISIYLIVAGMPAIREIGLLRFLFGKTWAPSQGLYGIFPMIVASIFVTAGAIIIGILLGIPFSLLGIELPTILSKTAKNIGGTASPIALLVIGATFEGKKALAEIKPTLVCSFVKLMLWPALFLPIAILLGFRDEKMVALLVMLGSPTTVSCYIMAKNMKHKAVLTSSVVVATTFLSSLTLTFWLYLLKSFGLI